MNYTTIKAGYRLTVTSWKNDGDNYMTKMLEGLTKEDVEFHVKFLKLFKSDSGGFGNLYAPSKMKRFHLAEAIATLVKANDVSNTNFAEVGDYLQDIDLEDEEYFEENVVDELLGDYIYDRLWDVGLSNGDDFYTRVMSSYKVEFVPQDIQIQDVTAEFS